MKLSLRNFIFFCKNIKKRGKKSMETRKKYRKAKKRGEKQEKATGVSLFRGVIHGVIGGVILFEKSFQR